MGFLKSGFDETADLGFLIGGVDLGKEGGIEIFGHGASIAHGNRLIFRSKLSVFVTNCYLAISLMVNWSYFLLAGGAEVGELSGG